MSYSLPKTIKIKNPKFSENVEEEINQLFPDISNKPLTKFKAEVEIVTCFDKNSTFEIYIDSSNNLQKTIIDCVTFASDLWLDGNLVDDENLSLLDLKHAVIRFDIKNVTISDFYVELDFAIKATNIKS